MLWEQRILRGVVSAGVRNGGLSAGVRNGGLSAGVRNGTVVGVRGFRTSSLSAGEFGGAWYEMRPPPLLPRRYNEDVRKRFKADGDDFNPQYELIEDHDVDSFPLRSEDASLFSGWIYREVDTDLKEFLVSFFVPLGFMFGTIAIGYQISLNPPNKRIWNPPRELPYYEEDTLWYGEARDQAWKKQRANPYTDYRGVNPMLRMDYKPDPIPTMAEAYPNGW